MKQKIINKLDARKLLHILLQLCLRNASVDFSNLLSSIGSKWDNLIYDALDSCIPDITFTASSSKSIIVLFRFLWEMFHLILMNQWVSMLGIFFLWIITIIISHTRSVSVWFEHCSAVKLNMLLSLEICCLILIICITLSIRWFCEFVYIRNNSR